mmetsp:Transcript_178995/g.567950  ORF Transcript_178995/g.567950 Transcript_178995/m.567950 type:complete len:227 (+) Transcript_178995:3066-3746(+)
MMYKPAFAHSRVAMSGRIATATRTCWETAQRPSRRRRRRHLRRALCHLRRRSRSQRSCWPRRRLRRHSRRALCHLRRRSRSQRSCWPRRRRCRHLRRALCHLRRLYRSHRPCWPTRLGWPRCALLPVPPQRTTTSHYGSPPVPRPPQFAPELPLEPGTRRRRARFPLLWLQRVGKGRAQSRVSARLPRRLLSPPSSSSSRGSGINLMIPRSAWVPSRMPPQGPRCR